MPVTSYLYDSRSGLKVTEGLSAAPHEAAEQILWVDVHTKDREEMNLVAQHYDLHELAVEDCFTQGHFPKIDEYGTYFFLVLRGLKPMHTVAETSSERDEIKYTHKLAIFLAPRRIITFHRQEIPWLDAFIRQVRQSPQVTIGGGADALAHRLIDILTDRFLRGLQHFEQIIDSMEETALKRPDEFEISDIFDLKRDLSGLRQLMRDQRVIFSRLSNDATLIPEKHLRRYFKDVDDHALTIINLLDRQIDGLLSLRDAYFAISNVRLGDTMRILAVITTLGVPLNLVVGVYGMNFEAIPLLHNPYGFWLVITFLIALIYAMLVYFKRRNWI